jgi:hypothetical protein
MFDPTVLSGFALTYLAMLGFLAWNAPTFVDKVFPRVAIVLQVIGGAILAAHHWSQVVLSNVKPLIRDDATINFEKIVADTDLSNFSLIFTTAAIPLLVVWFVAPMLQEDKQKRSG